MHSTHSASTAVAAPGAHWQPGFGQPAVTVVVAIVMAVVGTYIILKIVGAVTTLRADAAEEESGLDIVEHGERAYRQSIINGTPLTNLAVQEAPAFAAKPAPAGK